MKDLVFYTDFDYKDLDIFTSSLKHHLKYDGINKFIDKYMEEPNISDKAKRLYLVSLLEFLCNKENIQKPEWIKKYTTEKMEKTLFSQGAIMYFEITGDIDKLKTDYNKSIIEFKEHNIIETDICDVL